MSEGRTSSSPSGFRLPARLFIGAVSVCGIAIVVHSAAVLLRSTVPPEWVLFAILTVASGTLSIKIPSIQSRFSLVEVFALASVLLFGPDVGALTLALDGLRISIAWRMSRQQTVFNVANLGLSMWLSGSLFFLVSGTGPLFQSGRPSASVVVCLALMTASYFVINSGLTATVIALSGRRPVRAVWVEHYLPLLPSYMAGASIASLFVFAFREVQFTAVALILPLLLICYLTLRSSFGRLEDSKLHVAKLNRLLFSTVETLATAIDAKDEVTHDHVRRVQLGTMALARELGVSDPDTLKGLEAAALLHDTGKIAIPEHILNKPGRLTPSEFEKMKRHAPIGAQILSSIDFPYPVVPVVRHHHENWDGSGYPDGLKGENIPLGARILSVVDCFDALTSDRPYRRRMTEEQALKIIIDRRGTMYDPLVVDTFAKAHARIMPVADAMPHPAAQAIGEARIQDRDDARAEAQAAVTDVGVADGLLAITSLARAVGGDARISDVGALLWMIFRQVVPSDAMAIFVVDEDRDQVVARYAAGVHAQAIRGISRAVGGGMAGWVAVNRRPVFNGDPSIDLGSCATDPARPLRSCLALPLMDGEDLVAVLTLYCETASAFSEDHLRLLELLAPRVASALAGATFASDERIVPCAPAVLKLVKHG
ncbi:MAG TPA: HD domain-containing phosphohydrolase [Vicinamibacterales bacterium]|nr:HD domain-containing phosphohydrolase [Vicinamibacterales bacterium]